MITDRQLVKQFSRCTGVYCWDCKHCQIVDDYCSNDGDECYREFRTLNCQKGCWTLDTVKDTLSLAVALTSATACQMLEPARHVYSAALKAGWNKIHVFRSRELGAPYVQFDDLVQPPGTVINVGYKLKYKDRHGGVYEVVEVARSGGEISGIKLEKIG